MKLANAHWHFILSIIRHRNHQSYSLWFSPMPPSNRFAIWFVGEKLIPRWGAAQTFTQRRLMMQRAAPAPAVEMGLKGKCIYWYAKEKREPRVSLALTPLRTNPALSLTHVLNSDLKKQILVSFRRMSCLAELTVTEQSTGIPHKALSVDRSRSWTKTCVESTSPGDGGPIISIKLLNLKLFLKFLNNGSIEHAV